MANNYDTIASSYDRLSRLVFFRSQINAQKDQLPYIPPASRVLIVGGGTGWILKAIAQVQPHALNITFVDSSAKMINLAKMVDTGPHQVNFIQGAIEDQTFDHAFDVVITAFLFDNFEATQAEKVFHQLQRCLKPGGLWLFSDFTETPVQPWQSVLLKVMYIFFNYMAQVKATRLFKTSTLFQEHGYQQLVNKAYYGKFIVSRVYKKGPGNHA
jgi:ubiquinone/menaquinone biosynthesis C-methylase UbiE